MKTINSSKQDNTIDKLGISILNSIKQLNNLKKKMEAAPPKELPQLVYELRKAHEEFINKQQHLFSLEESSPKVERYRKEVERFKD